MRTHISIVTNDSSYSSTITQISNFNIISNILLFVFVVLIVTTIIYLLLYLYKWFSVKIRTVKITESQVTATVFDKEYKSPIFYGIMAGKIYIPQHTEEYYLLGVEYKARTYEVEVDEETYSKTQKGDKIDLILIKHYDKEGKIIRRKMELPE